MSTKIDDSLERLNRRLPLAARQAALPAEIAALHRAVLRSLFDRGRPPQPHEIEAMLREFTLREALDRLGGDDLVVLTADRERILGAYPMTSEKTPHMVAIGDRTVNAMCAIDALSISPMFGGEVKIRSKCRVNKTPVLIRQSGTSILSADPDGVMAGVRWEHSAGGHAAYSLCMEMVYLRDDAAALAWHRGDLENHVVLTLAEAVEFGARFFGPLVAGN
jgi:mercuric reductase